ncbi:hypothetical protein [Algoriphagus sp.]|uniref:hypothetical protein n=1 Tax=Algoriphagus sp. TaxID=1872435 RepID=UPI003919129E
MKNPNNDQVGLLLYQNTLEEIDSLIAADAFVSAEGADRKKKSNQMDIKVGGKLYVSYKNQKVYGKDKAFEKISDHGSKDQQRLLESPGVNLICTKVYLIDFLTLIRNFIYCKFHKFNSVN